MAKYVVVFWGVLIGNYEGDNRFLITKKYINLRLVLKNTVFIQNSIIITVTNSITKFIYSLVQYILVIP